MALGLPRAPRTIQATVDGSAAALGAASELLGGRRRQRQQTLRRRRAAVAPTASFDLGSFNFNPLDWLKVPRDQTQVTLYPWMAHSMREMAMRRWLQKEVGARAWQGAAAAGGRLDPGWSLQAVPFRWLRLYSCCNMSTLRWSSVA